MIAHEELTVESIGASELGAAARVLAEAFVEEPVMVWSMPKTATRLADITAFFTFILRRKGAHRREVFATSDRAAVAVMSLVGVSDGVAPNVLPAPARAMSSAADYIRWIETYRPGVPHWHLEFIGISPTNHARGLGSFLMKNLLMMSATEGLPVWTWSSNPRNLTFYHRLGFEAGAALQWDAETPPVTPLLWQPPVVAS